MNTQINTETIRTLTGFLSRKPDTFAAFMDALESFEAYHTAVHALEIRRYLYAHGCMDFSSFRELYDDLQQKQWDTFHEAVKSLLFLNRLAEENGLEPVYNGTISQERVHRIEIADAVLDYLNTLVSNRLLQA